MAGARVTARPLEPRGFAPFGQVLAFPSGAGREVNLGTAVRHDHAAALASTRPGATPNLALFRCEPQALPFRVTLLERHPCSTQLFAALRARRWLIVVAPSDAEGRPDVEALRAFVCGPGQGFNLAPGTWHHPVVALDEAAELLMLAWEDGGPRDGEECPLADGPEVVSAPE